MKTVTILKRARKLLAEPAAWCQGAFARRANGTPAPYSSPSAVAFCARGAIMRYCGEDDDRHAPIDALNRARRSRGTTVGWNDSPRRTHAEVLAAFDRAIALAEKDGGK